MEHPEMDMYAYERFLADGKTPFCGVDEAGRGPLAGPVCAAAVLLPEGLVIPGLNDSKKLTAKKRDALYDIICESAVAFGIAFATVDEIEALNIKGATYLAMNRAIADMEPTPVLALVDGNDKNELECIGIRHVVPPQIFNYYMPIPLQIMPEAAHNFPLRRFLRGGGKNFYNLRCTMPRVCASHGFRCIPP